MDLLELTEFETHVLSRGGRPGTIRVDLLTGEGLEDAVRGVEVIIPSG